MIVAEKHVPYIDVDGIKRSVVNSSGQAIHPTDEGIRKFWKWFADSCVVDADGKPLVVYHGTAAVDDFSEFAPMADNLGSHFGTSVHASVRREGAGSHRVIPVYLKIKNLLRLNDPETNLWANAIVAEQLIVKGLLEKEQWDELSDYAPDERGLELIDAIEEAGYDGVVYANEREGYGDSYIIFDPTTIKSAIGNSGEFDKNDPSFLV